jgi:hypothetical protein
MIMEATQLSTEVLLDGRLSDGEFRVYALVASNEGAAVATGVLAGWYSGSGSSLAGHLRGLQGRGIIERMELDGAEYWTVADQWWPRSDR